jgi:hypothetical protein
VDPYIASGGYNIARIRQAGRIIVSFVDTVIRTTR